MYTYNDYCNIVNDNVEVTYSKSIVPVLGEGPVEGSSYIDTCTHNEKCRQSYNNCPIFKKLNNM